MALSLIQSHCLRSELFNYIRVTDLKSCQTYYIGVLFLFFWTTEWPRQTLVHPRHLQFTLTKFHRRQGCTVSFLAWGGCILPMAKETKEVSRCHAGVGCGWKGHKHDKNCPHRGTSRRRHHSGNIRGFWGQGRREVLTHSNTRRNSSVTVSNSYTAGFHYPKKEEGFLTPTHTRQYDDGGLFGAPQGCGENWH